jgi:hypothetical protein
MGWSGIGAGDDNRKRARGAQRRAGVKARLMAGGREGELSLVCALPLYAYIPLN